MGGVSHGRCPVMGGVQSWEVPSHGRCPVMIGVQS